MDEARGGGGQPADLEKLAAAVQRFESLRTEALLANPLLDFERLVFVKRADAGQKTPRPRVRGEAANFVGNDTIGFLNGLPINFQGNGYLREIAFDNEIAVLSPVRPDGQLTTLYRPDKPVFVGDLKLHFDADRLLFSSVGSHGRWQIFEVGVDGQGLRQVTRGEESDIDNYDACYLPDERILFASSACFQSVPCERRCDEVANFCVMNPDGSAIRRLCFDQDHNFYPSIMADGRVLYTRWEYTDIAHAFTGRLMTMNPDGTGQRAHYASGSFWPNRIFYARPIPGCPTKFVAIITGHHGTARAGELVVFDVAKGRRLAEGVVQRIPGRGKTVQAVMVDNLVDASWPKFLHPYPLSDKYFLASCQPNPQSPWGLYLVDTFDNLLLLHEEPGCVLFEPVAVRKTPRPPVIPERVDLASREGDRLLAGHLLRQRTAGRPPRHGPEAAAVHLPFQLLRHVGYRGLRGHGRPVGRPPRARHGAGGRRRFRLLYRPGEHADRHPAVGRRREGRAADAELVHRHAGRNRLVYRLPRTGQRYSSAIVGRPAGRFAAAHHAVARPGARVQLGPRGTAGAGQVLRGLPQRPTAARRRRTDRPAAGGASQHAAFAVPLPARVL